MADIDKSGLFNEAGGLFNILPDLFVGMLSRQWDCRFVAAALGVNALVADIDEQSKHLGDFRLPFRKYRAEDPFFLPTLTVRMRAFRRAKMSSSVTSSPT